MIKVEGWTKADTGLRAVIAAGSQNEKDNCGLFVKYDKITKKYNIFDKYRI